MLLTVISVLALSLLQPQDIVNQRVLSTQDVKLNDFWDMRPSPDGQKIVDRIYVQLGPLEDGWRVILNDVSQSTPTSLPADRDYIVDGNINARPGLPVQIQTEEQVAARAAAK